MSWFKKKKKRILPEDADVGEKMTLIRKLPNQGKRKITFERKKKKGSECWIIVNNEPIKRGRPPGSKKKKRRKK